MSDYARDTRIEAGMEEHYRSTSENGVIKPIKETKVPELKAISASDLMKKDIPPINWYVKELLPEGLAILAAPSKYYKSFMALQLCVAICTGTEFLGFQCEKHGCLYLDLESTERRPKQRLDMISGEKAGEINNLYFITGTQEVSKIGNGFEQQIEQQLSEHEDIGMLVVDVFQLIRQSRKGNQNAYEGDYSEFKLLKKLADDHGLLLLVIHHTNKGDKNDVFDKMSGSTAMLGAMDCAWMITKENRDSLDAVLHVTGRDIESRNLRIKFDKSTFRWEYVSSEEDFQQSVLTNEYEQSEVVDVIKRMVKVNGGHWEATAGEIKKCGEMINVPIYDTPQKIGSKINEYSVFFFFNDGIRVDTARKGHNGARTYIFNDSNDSNVSNVSSTNNVSSCEQIEMFNADNADMLTTLTMDTDGEEQKDSIDSITTTNEEK